jgi:hypothetical protein
MALATVACGRTPIDGVGASATGSSTSYPHPRQPYFTPSSERYPYYEGIAVANGYFESDYDRSCGVDADCAGLGRPASDTGRKSEGKGSWLCTQGACQYPNR